MKEINLFSPLKIRGMSLRNRIVMSPMQQYSSENGKVGNWHYVHLGSRAVGGAALIITECTAVSKEGMNTPEDAGLWNTEQMEAWKPIVTFCQQNGSKIAVQLWHSGGKGSHSHKNGHFKYIGPEQGGRITKSASPFKLDEHHFSVALTLEEILSIKSDFIHSAKLAVEAGFDCLEIHAGHGYIFHQFYSALVNHRDDLYGGSFENRIRLLVETIVGIREAVPEDMPILVRISATDYSSEEKGWNIEDSVKLSEHLMHIGVDVITASGGGFVQVEKSRVFPGYQLPMAEEIKRTGILVGAVGMITDAEQANAIIKNGNADLAIIGREYLRDPYFAIHAAEALKLELHVPEQYSRAY